jgi:hypothetical protein
MFLQIKGCFYERNRLNKLNFWLSGPHLVRGPYVVHAWPIFIFFLIKKEAFVNLKETIELLIIHKDHIRGLSYEFVERRLRFTITNKSFSSLEKEKFFWIFFHLGLFFPIIFSLTVLVLLFTDPGLLKYEILIVLKIYFLLRCI